MKIEQAVILDRPAWMGCSLLEPYDFGSIIPGACLVDVDVDEFRPADPASVDLGYQLVLDNGGRDVCDLTVIATAEALQVLVTDETNCAMRTITDRGEARRLAAYVEAWADRP